MVFCRIILCFLNFNLPKSIEHIISAIITPFFFLLIPVEGFLESLGLMEGAWWKMPSYLGLLVAVVAYALMIYIVCLCILILYTNLISNKGNSG
jgi:hypothetical protein